MGALRRPGGVQLSYRPLLFLDEIQVAPELFAGLRYFYERMPELHVIAAGSLLDFALADHRFSALFAKIPRLVGSKFTYSRGDREGRSRELRRALDLLCLARIAYRVRHSSANGVPLGAEADDRSFKVLFLDVGLLGRSCGLSVLDMERAEDLMMVNAGSVCEQFVGQHLLYSREFFAEPEL